MGFKDSLFRGAGGVGKEAWKVVAGIKPIDNKVPPIKTDIKSSANVEKVSLSGVLGQVIKGSKVPEAGIKAKGDWRKKLQEKPKPETIDKSAFANNIKEYKRQRAAEWIAKELRSGNLKDLKGRFYRLFGFIPKTNDPIEKKLALAEKIFGSKKERMGLIIHKKTDSPLNLAMRNRKFREKIIPAAKYKKDFRGIEQEKLNQEILNRFFEGKKN
ncbi:MAG: hypothetical protein ABIB55_00590 [Candidatus Nealsonbacteria bacterium]